MPLHEQLGEDLAAFELRGVRGRAEHRDPRLFQPVGQTAHQRRFRAHHDEIVALLGRVIDEPVDVFRRDRHVLGVPAGAAVAGGAAEPGQFRTSGKSPRQGVFAPSAADE